MAFTTWSAALADFKDQLTNRDQTLRSYRTPDGQEYTFASTSEKLKFLSFLEGKAAAESGTPGTASRRAYVRPLGDTW